MRGDEGESIYSVLSEHLIDADVRNQKGLCFSLCPSLAWSEFLSQRGASEVLDNFTIIDNCSDSAN